MFHPKLFLNCSVYHHKSLTDVSALLPDFTADVSFGVGAWKLVCLTGLTGLGWIDLEGLTGFCSRIFVRSLPCLEQTCKVLLLSWCIGGASTWPASVQGFEKREYDHCLLFSYLSHTAGSCSLRRDLPGILNCQDSNAEDEIALKTNLYFWLEFCE